MEISNWCLEEFVFEVLIENEEFLYKKISFMNIGITCFI